MTLLEARVRKVEKMPAKKFLDLSPERKADIKSVRIVSPKLGKPGFGYVEVTYKTPRYSTAMDAFS